MFRPLETGSLFMTPTVNTNKTSLLLDRSQRGRSGTFKIGIEHWDIAEPQPNINVDGEKPLFPFAEF